LQEDIMKMNGILSINGQVCNHWRLLIIMKLGKMLNLLIVYYIWIYSSWHSQIYWNVCHSEFKRKYFFHGLTVNLTCFMISEDLMGPSCLCVGHSMWCRFLFNTELVLP
jgi:hypothetical protein